MTLGVWKRVWDWRCSHVKKIESVVIQSVSGSRALQGYLAHKKATQSDPPRRTTMGPYRGTSLIRNSPLPGTTIGP